MSDVERARVLTTKGAVTTETRVVSVLVSLLTIGLVDNQLLAAILPDIARTLSASEVAVGRTVVGYAIAAAIAALIVGPLSDAWGRRSFLVAAGAVFGVGSVFAVVAPTFMLFIVARVVTGGAAGIISALVVAAIADVVPYHRRGRAMGWVAAAYFAAPTLGVFFATWIAARAGWRANYVLFAAVSAIATLAVALWFDEPTREHRAVRSARDYVRFLRERSTAAGALSAFFVTGGLTGFLLFLPAYLRARYGLSVTDVGLVFVLSGVASLIGALSAGWLADRVGKLRVALAGSAALAFFLIVVPETGGAPLYLTLGLVGVAAAARVAPLQSLVTQLVTAEERGAYVALRNTLSQCGSAAAAALASALYGFGYQYVCHMTSAFSITALVLLLLIDEPVAET
jgi:predicted MFS family arabinose efflux permease